MDEALGNLALQSRQTNVVFLAVLTDEHSVDGRGFCTESKE